MINRQGGNSLIVRGEEVRFFRTSLFLARATTANNVEGLNVRNKRDKEEILWEKSLGPKKTKKCRFFCNLFL